MATYIVSALHALQSPLGVVLDRIVGPGWTETPAKMLNHLIHNRHQFVLAGTGLQLAARRQGADTWLLVIVDRDGREVAAESLPHWQLEQQQKPARAAQSWWQRLLGPDLA